MSKRLFRPALGMLLAVSLTFSSTCGQVLAKQKVGDTRTATSEEMELPGEELPSAPVGEGPAGDNKTEKLQTETRFKVRTPSGYVCPVTRIQASDTLAGDGGIRKVDLADGVYHVLVEPGVDAVQIAIDSLTGAPVTGNAADYAVISRWDGYLTSREGQWYLYPHITDMESGTATGKHFTVELKDHKLTWLNMSWEQFSLYGSLTSGSKFYEICISLKKDGGALEEKVLLLLEQKNTGSHGDSDDPAADESESPTEKETEATEETEFITEEGAETEPESASEPETEEATEKIAEPESEKDTEYQRETEGVSETEAWPETEAQTEKPEPQKIDKNVAELEAQIRALPKVITLAQKKAVNRLLAAYNKLTAEQRKQLGSKLVQKLKDSTAQLQKLEQKTEPTTEQTTDPDVDSAETDDNDDDLPDDGYTDGEYIGGGYGYSGGSAADRASDQTENSTETESESETESEAESESETEEVAEEEAAEETEADTEDSENTKNTKNDGDPAAEDLSEEGKQAIQKMSDMFGTFPNEWLSSADPSTYTDEEVRYLLDFWMEFTALPEEDYAIVEATESYEVFHEITTGLGEINHADEKSGVNLQDNGEELIPWHVKVEVEPEQPPEDIQMIMNNRIDGEYTLYELNDISFTDLCDGEEWQPDESVKLKLPMVDLGDYPSAVVIHVKHDGTTEFLPCEQVGDYMECETTSFSSFGVIGMYYPADELLEPHKNMVLPLFWAISGAGSLILLLYVMLRGSAIRRRLILDE